MLPECIPSAILSFIADIVTVWGEFQFEDVNVKLEGEISTCEFGVPETITSEDGGALKVTE
jgi:hypothetical protein